MDRRRALCQKTVDTFSGLTGRTLTFEALDEREDGKWWVTSEAGSKTIRADLTDAHYYSATELALGHVVFGSDRGALRRWSNLYSAEFARLCEDEGVAVKPADVIGSVQAVAAVLDNYRVRQLWGDVYVGSSQDMLAMLRMHLQNHAPDPHGSLIEFLAWQAADPSKVREGDYTPYSQVVQDHLLLLHGHGYGQVLAVVRSLIRALVDVFAAELSAETAAASSRAAAAAAVMGMLSPEEKLTACYARVEFSGQSQAALRAADKAVEDGKGEPRSYEGGDAGMAAVADKLRSPGASTASGDSSLALDCQTLWETISAVTPGLQTYDWVTAERIRNTCLRAVQRSARVFDDSGGDVDIQQMIARRVSKQPVPVFSVPLPTKGFRAIVLVDRSQSMGGMHYSSKSKTDSWDWSSRIGQAYRSANILVEAARIPKVHLDVWGFTSRGNGTLLMSKYAAHCGEPTTPIRGGTPIHLALRAAVNELSNPSETSHIFLLTDGDPSFTMFDGKPAFVNDLITATRNVVTIARQRRTIVSTLLIGPAPKKDDGSGISDVRAAAMFGHGYARAEMPEDIPRILVPLVSSALLRWARTL